VSVAPEKMLTELVLGIIPIPGLRGVISLTVRAAPEIDRRQ
jgi:hypothetical protein